MSTENQKFESKTIRAIRGTESRAIAKWQADGWEVVGQSAGRLNTEIRLRRPQPKKNWFLIGSIAAAAAAFIVFALIMAALEGPEPTPGNEAAATDAATASSEESSESTAASEAAPSAPEQVAAPPEIITSNNNSEFAALLTLTDTCSADITAFAEKYAGQTIVFDASIDNLIPHGDYDTRFDFLVTAGNYSMTESSGPNFLFRDFNYSDLNLTGANVPDEIRGGENVRVTATLDEFVVQQCLFLVEPVETAMR
ncbi:DUF4839 domain-containing protein [Pseudoclavibacter terrae]|uniref:DUF4839 domain-containing protein n=1 Tax=Pseudoclavibacter terrae TaxID=1530195 RepID=A0A7J5AZB3_9MICO|nr:DUF4839 domain-containing protein [Pseudoclavibacter terrae]KAB1636796.1 DUF4839 domain-containing protein [Pseudoclavibacter terrae]